MDFARLKNSFLRMPRSYQLIGVGALILAIATLLPWYQDIDTYRIGDEFLGVTGPAALIGIVILALSGSSFILFSYRLFEKRAPRLPVREAVAHLFAALQSLFLTIIVVSIYFHPRFGYNIALKETRMGVMFAFVGSITLLVGAYLKNKEELARVNDEGHLEPLIKIDQSHEAVAQTRQHSPIAQRQQPVEPTRSFSFGERGGSTPAAPAVPATPSEQTESEGSFKIRMDL